MTVQLALVGMVLTALFAVVSPLWTGLAALGMILFAGHEVLQRQERRLSGWWSYGLGTACMMMASVLVTSVCPTDRPAAEPLVRPALRDTAARYDPWQLHDRHCPRSRYPDNGPGQPPRECRSAADARRDKMGGRCAGNPRCASQRADADHQFDGRYRAGFLPGMMTGQILSGVTPAEAVKYQILVMFLIAGGTGFGAVAAVLGGVYRLTDARHRLRLDRLILQGRIEQ